MAKKATPKEKKKRKERNLVEATSEEEGGNRIRGPGRRWQRWRSASVSALLQYSLSTCYHLQSFDFIPEADQAEYADNYRPLGLPNTCDLLINGAAYTLFRQFPWITSPSGPQFDSLEVQKFSTTAKWKFASRYYSGMHSTIWKCKLYCSGVRKIVWDMSAGVRGSSRHTKFFTLAKFWMSDDREMTKGLLSNVETLRFTTVLDVRGAGHEERVAQTTCPHRIKKGRNFWRGEDFSKSSLSQQPSSAPFSAGILCSHPRSHPQAISHLAVVSGWWAAFSQPSNINLRWSWVGGRLFLNYWTSTSCRQLLVVIHERVPWKNPLTAFSGKKGECPEPNAVVSTSWAKTWKPSCSC